MLKPADSNFLKRIRISNLVFLGLVALLVDGLLWPVIDGVWSRFDFIYQDSGYRSSFVPSFESFDDVVRFVFGGNWAEYGIGFNSEGWAYQGSPLLIRESNLFNLIATFGVLPMCVVFWKWLTPFVRLRSRDYNLDPAGIAFLAAFLTGIFTIVHDYGIVNWNNVFFFYAFYECGRMYQTRKLDPSRARSQIPHPSTAAG